MTIDLLTLSLMVALVVHVAGVLFIVETMLRKEDRSGRVWALAFLAAMLTTEAYMVWAATEGSWWAVAVGNATFVGGTGLLWLGCRSFNDRTIQRQGAIVALAAAATAVAVALEGDAGGDWAGHWLLFGGNAVFAALGAAEAWRGAMRRNGTAIGLGIVLAIEAVFFGARLVVSVTVGTDSEVFRVWLGSEVSGILTIVLTIVAVVVASVLRAESVRMRGTDDSAVLAIAPDGVLLRSTFLRVLGGRLMRANRREELFGVLAVHIDALPRIATAFGADEAEHVRQTVRAAARRLSPTTAVLGADDDGTLLLAFQPATLAEARQLAARVHRAMLDQLRTAGAQVMPAIGMGVSLTSVVGYDHRAIVASAIAAAQRAIGSDDTSVVLAGEEDVPVGRRRSPHV
ncbi:diguanylate cyclase [Agrococcus terreus]|uniref:GGDEF domain-containing protein, diguanylate cyclase (C-di-GMP synthetase) or its enzymatically inactive variants n=1 Tax=Agrococcus terreus TaxID=574649 RepID=A0ABQ2KHM3_9MICO|nr:diguanylate cyclase [Agrococcus terreus]GGN83768.1 hypothetical protein GCM10010968_14910 [Agrococcus terreus]